MSQVTPSGHCYCQSVQFNCEPPFGPISHCHCDSCRTSHGAAFVTWTSVTLRQMKVTAGEHWIRQYQSSPGTFWKFCGNCGTQLFQITANDDDRIYIAFALLRNVSDALKPKHHVSYEERLSWLDGAAALPCYFGKHEREIQNAF